MQRGELPADGARAGRRLRQLHRDPAQLFWQRPHKLLRSGSGGCRDVQLHPEPGRGGMQQRALVVWRRRRARVQRGALLAIPRRRRSKGRSQRLRWNDARLLRYGSNRLLRQRSFDRGHLQRNGLDVRPDSRPGMQRHNLRYAVDTPSVAAFLIPTRVKSWDCPWTPIGLSSTGACRSFAGSSCISGRGTSVATGGAP